MKRITRSAIVEHGASAMYALVEDIEAYPQFLPWCRKALVRERTPQRTVATLAVGVKGLRYEFTTQNANRPHEAIDLKLLEGPFRHFAAHWRFSALGARAARIEFAMEYQFAGALVSRALGPLFETIADTMVDAFKRRADAVYGQAAR
ncbi:MAG: type II toxin-antitoxin system RatA family toxin [Betaproteobacteria bacterium]|nr:type II toxin-antitoxin system RatA family toxin [Betaproteobacteria bacterium]